MSEIDNNLNAPFQVQNNNQNQGDYNQQIQNMSLTPINNQIINDKNIEDEKKLFFPKPFYNYEVNKALDTSQNLNYGQNNIPYINQPFINPQFNNQISYGQQHPNLHQVQNNDSICCLCKILLGIFCAIAIVIIAFYGVAIYSLTHYD